jgi:hypothetical protein
LDLKLVPLLGRKFTWSNQRGSPTLIKLYHVFCTSTWVDLFPDHALVSNASITSNHYPLILKLHEEFKGKCRFHYEIFWWKLPGFLNEVAASWNLPVHASCPLARLSWKLRHLARNLQSWEHNNVGDIKAQLGWAREILHRLEIAQDRRLLSRDES